MAERDRQYAKDLADYKQAMADYNDGQGERKKIHTGGGARIRARVKTLASYG